jgi:hypothetical protein
VPDWSRMPPQKSGRRAQRQCRWIKSSAFKMAYVQEAYVILEQQAWHASPSQHRAEPADLPIHD